MIYSANRNSTILPYQTLLRTHNSKQGLGVCILISPDVTRQCFLVGTWGRGRNGWRGRWIRGDNDRKNKHMNK